MIYVALPVHNERHTVGVLLWRLRQVFTEINRDFRILVVDDASTDGTPEVLEPYSRVLPLTLLRNERREGYARCLERLIREAVHASQYPKRDGLVVMQADFTDGPEWIPEMLKRFQGGADLVAGRAVGVRDVPRPVRLARLGTRFFARPVGIPDGVDDPFCSFRLYRLTALKRALRDLSASGDRLLLHDGWAASLELLRAVSPHLRRTEQVEIPTDYSRRYRRSRFRALPALWGLVRASRDRRHRDSGTAAIVEG